MDATDTAAGWTGFALVVAIVFSWCALGERVLSMWGV